MRLQIPAQVEPTGQRVLVSTEPIGQLQFCADVDRADRQNITLHIHQIDVISWYRLAIFSRYIVILYLNFLHCEWEGRDKEVNLPSVDS